MRSGLSLRIPGMHEISPSGQNLKANSASSSFIKPSSPRPSQIKTHYRTVTQTSPYNRIISNTSIKKLSFPSFLRSSSASKEEILTKIPIGKMTPVQTSDIATDSSSIRNEEVKLNLAKMDLKDPAEFFKVVFRKKENKDEVILKVGKFDLARGDLQTLEPKSSISRNVIDACLRCINHKNRKFFKSTEFHDRVFIVDTQFSQLIFTADYKKWPSLDRNPLKYEFVLFPIFIDYWTLVALDNKMKKVFIYNVENNSVLNEIFDCVKKFVARELKVHEKRSIDSTGWRELRPESTHIQGIIESDSAALMIRIAYKIAINNKAVLSSEVLNDFRYNLLIMLYKHGTQPNFL